jgi:hypothetical protein
LNPILPPPLLLPSLLSLSLSLSSVVVAGEEEGEQPLEAEGRQREAVEASHLCIAMWGFRLEIGEGDGAVCGCVGIHSAAGAIYFAVYALSSVLLHHPFVSELVMYSPSNVSALKHNRANVLADIGKPGLLFHVEVEQQVRKGEEERWGSCGGTLRMDLERETVFRSPCTAYTAYLLSKQRRHRIEVVFRSVCHTLMDAATSEYMFISDFFGDASMFLNVWGGQRGSGEK